MRDVAVALEDFSTVDKHRYPHVMLKEIFEQPNALRETLDGRLDPSTGEVILEGSEEANIGMAGKCFEDLGIPDKVFIVACGTSYHAGLIGRAFIERLAGIPVEVDLASEFKYRYPLIGPKDLLVVVSQSGETADTLGALREGRRAGAPVVAVTNVKGSTIMREADYAVITCAGPEVAVASTKAHTAQIACLALLAMKIASFKGRNEALAGFGQGLLQLPSKVEEALRTESDVEKVASYISKWDHAFFIGRGVDFPTALEGQLKLKETSYIHGEGYAAGELKHGALALIAGGIPVIAIATQEHVFEKTLSNATEIRARGGWVTLVTTRELYSKAPAGCVDQVLFVPSTHPLLQPVVSVIPLQMLAYHVARFRNCDIDNPRNLVKSVMVE
jgi:glucosamine--fructose-6-phosphate aminotransferase (isomerizing)